LIFYGDFKSLSSTKHTEIMISKKVGHFVLKKFFLIYISKFLNGKENEFVVHISMFQNKKKIK